MNKARFTEPKNIADAAKRILCVEDDFDSGELIRYLISRENSDYEVTVAATVAEAEKLISKNQFDLFIFDYCLPSKSGIQLCRQIRLNDQSTPIVFYSAMGRPSDREIAAQAGATEYLVKPLDLDKVAKTVNHLLNKTIR